MSVAICSYHFKHTVVNGQQRHIKGSTTKIKHQDILFSLFLVHTISNCSSRGLVNDSHNIETSNGSSILGGLTLGIIEIGRHCDNRMSDFLAKVGFCNFLKEYSRELDAQCHVTLQFNHHWSTLAHESLYSCCQKPLHASFSGTSIHVLELLMISLKSNEVGAVAEYRAKF